jgi:preprotein translocase SecF subunit
MITDTFVIIGLYAVFNLSFDLTSVAAFLTVVGYSVNDTIVIFDRIRENLVLQPKRNLRDTINRALNETLGRSINTSVATGLSLAGMLFFTSGQIWNFSLAMLVGVVAATLTTSFLSSAVMLWFENWRRSRGVSAKPATAAAT